jgi:hypothetical protein
MSHPTSYVAWESPDGSWNLGVYDPRDERRLEWVSTGHATYDQALAAWDGANPGHGPHSYRASAHPGSVTALDEMAGACSNNDETRRNRRRRSARVWRGAPATGPYPPLRRPGSTR